MRPSDQGSSRRPRASALPSPSLEDDHRQLADDAPDAAGPLPATVSAGARTRLVVLSPRRSYRRPIRNRDLEILHEILDTRGGFGHREHLELAWNYLRLYPIDEAAGVMVAAIRHIARLHRGEDKYHETITRAWLHFVAVHSQRWGAESFEGFIERNPDLLDQKLIGHFYSRELIRSQAARATWAVPDLHRRPALV